MQKSRSNQHGTRRSRRGQEIGFQKRGKLYELLTKGEGGWGQRSQKVTGDHPVRGLRDRGWERDAAVHDNVPPRTQCSRGAGILPLGTEDCKVREWCEHRTTAYMLCFQVNLYVFSIVCMMNPRSPQILLYAMPNSPSFCYCQARWGPSCRCPSNSFLYLLDPEEMCGWCCLTQGLSTSALLLSGLDNSLLWRGCPGHYRLSRSIISLYPLDASSTHTWPLPAKPPAA